MTLGREHYSATKSVALMASMVALGNVLALISMCVGDFHPQVALDFSHLATAIVAIYSGPTMGMITGALVGMAPYYRLGVVGWLGPFLGFVGLVGGKALSGLFFGLLGEKIRPFPAIVLGFLPESVYIYVLLKFFTRLVLPPQIASAFTDVIIISVQAKAWFEIVIIAVIMDIVKKRKIIDAILAPTGPSR
jgi:hypothetical protein